MEKGHGRLEIRELWALSVTPEQMGFYGAAQIARLRRRLQNLKTGQESDETALIITGLEAQPDAKANGAFLLQIARNQWSIENGLHYTRDRSYDEDRCPVREPNSAQILALLRSMARFLVAQGAHRPRAAHQRTVPALHRFCTAHRNQAIHWLISPHGFR